MFVSIDPDCSPPTCTQVSETIPGLRVSVMSVGLKRTFFRSDWDLLKASFFKVLFLMHSNKPMFLPGALCTAVPQLQNLDSDSLLDQTLKSSALHRNEIICFMTARLPRSRT